MVYIQDLLRAVHTPVVVQAPAEHIAAAAAGHIAAAGGTAAVWGTAAGLGIAAAERTAAAYSAVCFAANIQ
jgi:hypothetical protein